MKSEERRGRTARRDEGDCIEKKSTIEYRARRRGSKVALDARTRQRTRKGFGLRVREENKSRAFYSPSPGEHRKSEQRGQTKKAQESR
jgi:hypothetical protein